MDFLFVLWQVINWYLFPSMETQSDQIPPLAADIGDVKLQIHTVISSSLLMNFSELEPAFIM